MQCFACGTKNTGGVTYCAKCGAKLDMTADEIQSYYAQKVRDEKRTAAEFYSRRLLIFSVVLLLISITFLIMAGGAGENTSYIPSAASQSEFVRWDYEIEPDYRGLLIPTEEKR
jgi:uncharacterized membrane protein YvbJ